MRLLATRPNNSMLPGVAQHLVELLSYSKSDVWIVSPWFRDVVLPLHELGHYEALLGRAQGPMNLSELVGMIASQHDLKVVTKPPHELVRLELLTPLRDKMIQRAQLIDRTDLDDELQAFLRGLDDDVERLVRELLTHSESMEFFERAADMGAHVHFVDNLHTKATLSPTGALVGSANLTNGGLKKNDELAIELTDDRALNALERYMRELLDRSEPLEDYSLGTHLHRARVETVVLFELATSRRLSDYVKLQSFFDRLSRYL